MDGDPDDATLLAVLDADRTEAWTGLAELARDFRDRPQADDDCVWEQHYPRYGARVEAARRLLVEVGAVTPLYHWTVRERPVLGADGALGAGDAVRLATAIVRSERFGDGNIEAALAAGELQAVVVALAEWRRGRPACRG